MRRNGPSALALPTSVLMAALWVVIACSSVGGGSPLPAASSSAVSPALPSTLAGSSPEDIPGAPASQDPNAPPGAVLSSGSTAIPGMTGSYCWTVAGTSACADLPSFTDSAPGLPVLTMAGPTAPLQFSLANNFAFASWTASYVDDNGNVVALGGGGSSFDPDAAHQSIAAVTSASFGPPPAHDQSIVQVFVRFADGGDASYGWNVTVP